MGSTETRAPKLESIGLIWAQFTSEQIASNPSIATFLKLLKTERSIQWEPKPNPGKDGWEHSLLLRRGVDNHRAQEETGSQRPNRRNKGRKISFRAISFPSSHCKTFSLTLQHRVQHCERQGCYSEFRQITGQSSSPQFGGI